MSKPTEDSRCHVCGQRSLRRVKRPHEHAVSHDGRAPVTIRIPDLDVVACTNPDCHPEHPDDTVLLDGDASWRITVETYRQLGLLTPTEIRANRERLGLTQQELQDLLGLGGNSLSRWENGRVYQSRALDKFLRTVFAMPETLDALRSWRGPWAIASPACRRDVHRQCDSTEERANVDLFVGLDPGGKKRFGWCILSGDRLPLRVVSRGIACHAQEAVTAVLDAVGRNSVAGAGIDAPLFWQPTGDRHADQLVRNGIVARGSASGTVNHVNSMRGACLIQGMMAALLLRARMSRLPITETHPKALLWLLEIDHRGKRPDKVTLYNLSRWIADAGGATDAEEDERDAALSALAAFAMTSAMAGWQNLYLKEEAPITPLDPPPGYWLPI